MKNSIILGLVAAFSFGAAVLFTANKDKLIVAESHPSTYTLFVDEHTFFSNIYSVSESKDRGTVKTSLGADVEFEYSHDAKVETTAAFIEFANSGGEIHNVDPINGLFKIDYSCNQDLNLYYGFSPNNLIYSRYLSATGASWDPDGSFTFESEYGHPTYFKISSPSDTQIYRLRLHYSCIPSPDPYGTKGTWEYVNHNSEITITGFSINSEDIPEDGVLAVPNAIDGVPVHYIDAGALANVPWVRHIVLPFVGQAYFTPSDGKSEEFGSIFASSLPPGGTYIPMQQRYNTWYIPRDLTKVTVYHGNSTDHSLDYNIPDYAFYGADNLTEINIYGPISSEESTNYRTKRIGQYAFANCVNVSELYLPMSINYINSNAFAGNEDMIIRSYGSINITDAMNPNYARVTENYWDTVTYNGIIYDLYKSGGNTYANAMGLVSEPASSNLHLEGDIVVGNNTYHCKSVANRAFSDISEYTRISLPAGMEKVGHLAFKGDYMASIIVRDDPSDDSVYLSNWAQDTGVVAPEYTGEALTQFSVRYLELKSGYFADYVTDNAAVIQLDQFDINVPVYVGAYFAQNNENITSVSLPKNVTMGRASFINCANLSIVQYAGTVEEWNTLYSSGKIGANTFANTQVTEIICNGGATPVYVSFTSPNA